ncbi:MAG: hypothetical protein HW404_982, partial [Anaerolineales bacterium]|nr:hypothetical protein [Anaerolineales bacterium]
FSAAELAKQYAAEDAIFDQDWARVIENEIAS